MVQKRDATGLLVGGAIGALAGAVTALLATRPAADAPNDEIHDYLVRLGEANLLLSQGLVASINDQLVTLNKTMRDIREISGSDFAFDPLRYVTWKLRSGEAIEDKGSYYLLVGGGATVIFTMTNPEGYVWIGIRESSAVSQNGVFELTRDIDGGALPWIYIARLAEETIDWFETIPFGLVIRETVTVTLTNNDPADQWFIGTFYGIYLRKDVWEKDSKLIDLLAAKYSHPPEVSSE